MDILRNPFPDCNNNMGNIMVGIVFVQQRCVASSLSCIVNEFVKQYPHDFGHIKVDWCVGGADSETYKMPAAQKWAVENECRQKMNENKQGVSGGKFEQALYIWLSESILLCHNIS